MTQDEKWITKYNEVNTFVEMPGDRSVASA